MVGTTISHYKVLAKKEVFTFRSDKPDIILAKFFAHTLARRSL